MKRSTVTYKPIVGKCDFCSKEFVNKKSYDKHACEKSRRFLDLDKTSSRIAYNLWFKFFAINYPNKKKTSQLDFIGDVYYSAFIRLGVYCVDVGVIDPEQYVEYLVQNKISIDAWCQDSKYEQYLIHYLKQENYLDAVYRVIKLMKNITEQENIRLGDLFRYYSRRKICNMLVTGKMSMWVMLNCSSGINFLKSLDEDEIKFVEKFLDLEYWKIKFTRQTQEVQRVKDILSKVDGL